MLNKTQMAALLGRPLTLSEDTNFTEYLASATETLEFVLCASLKAETEERVFGSRQEFSTLFTDYFTAVTQVKIDGKEVSYSPRQWDNRNATWFNSLVFNDELKGKEVSVTASWGFKTLPQDLATLLARVFALNGESGGTGNVQAKQIEDFRLTINVDKTEFQGLLDDNATTLNRYAMCKAKADVQNGDINNAWRFWQ